MNERKINDDTDYLNSTRPLVNLNDYEDYNPNWIEIERNQVSRSSRQTKETNFFKNLNEIDDPIYSKPHKHSSKIIDSFSSNICSKSINFFLNKFKVILVILNIFLAVTFLVFMILYCFNFSGKKKIYQIINNKNFYLFIIHLF